MGRRRNITGGGPATAAILRGRRQVPVARLRAADLDPGSRRRAVAEHHPAALQKRFFENLTNTESHDDA